MPLIGGWGFSGFEKKRKGFNPFEFTPLNVLSKIIPIG
jgi:hypothetical protein